MKLNVKFHSDDKTMKVGFDQYIGGSSSVEVPTKLSELENDVGYITADDIPEGGGGTVSWDDIEDKPFDEVPAFDIQWDGDMSDRFTLDMSKFGYDAGAYLVKVNDAVFTIEELVGATVSTSIGTEYVMTESEIDSQSFPGAYNLYSFVAIVHNQSLLNKALGLPDGYVTNGVYFLINSKIFVNKFTSANKIVKIGLESLPMDTIIDSVIASLPIYNGEVEEV